MNHFNYNIRTKGHIAPREPYIATFFYNVFQWDKEKSYHLFEAVRKKNVLIFIGIKERNFCFCE